MGELLEGKMGEGVMRCLLPTIELLFYFLGFLRLCQCWWKSIKKCERESARRRRLGHRQTGFIICPMLYML